MRPHNAERRPLPLRPEIALPRTALVLLIGPAGCGKSTFARAHFRPTQIVSSDTCRALVSDDETDQTATAHAFAVLRVIIDHRLRVGRLTVVDATNVERSARAPLLDLARRRGVPAVAVVFDLPERVCRERNDRRPARYRVPDEALDRQFGWMRGSDPADEGFVAVHPLRHPAQVQTANVYLVDVEGVPPGRSAEAASPRLVARPADTGPALDDERPRPHTPVARLESGQPSCGDIPSVQRPRTTTPTWAGRRECPTAE